MCATLECDVPHLQPTTKVPDPKDVVNRINACAASRAECWPPVLLLKEGERTVERTGCFNRCLLAVIAWTRLIVVVLHA